MKQIIKKRSVILSGRHTSVSLEEKFWEVLKLMAEKREISVAGLIEEIETQRKTPNLSSAIRLAVLDHAIAQHAARVDHRAG